MKQESVDNNYIIKRPKVAVIIPYFGKWPEYFNLYLYSCSKNPQIDFFYFTDCCIPNTSYPNTHFVKTSFSKYCKKVSSALKINFKPNSPKKLCDVKPFYGIIHKEDIKDYDFWGFADIDLIYGDMSLFVNNYNLNKYDVITSLSIHLSGHFTLIRKSSKYTVYGYKIKDWKSKLENQKNLWLDESDFSKQIHPLLHIFRFFFFHGINRLTKKMYKTHQFFLNCTQWLTPKLFFKEAYSTLDFYKDAEWKYMINEGKLIPPRTIFGIPDNVGGNYLHFYLMKNGVSWKGKSIYNIPTDYDFLQSDDVITINKKGICLDKISS